jgi:lipopolysaccharide kinase (Kdo/WaaP) family protein
VDDAQPRSILKRGAKRTLWVRAGHGSQGDVVVKRFHAPGLFGRFLDPGRAALERRALQALLDRGLPVPEPLAIERNAGGVDLVMRPIEGARSLAEIVRAGNGGGDRIARELGSLLARAALCGLRHPDLHSGNVLVDAHGHAWLVDLRGARAGGEFSWREHEHALIVLAADLRERTTAPSRARVLVACTRVLRRSGRVDLPPTRDMARAIDLAARLRRRTVVARSSRRWLRASSAAVPLERSTDAGPERGFRERSAPEARCWQALDARPGNTLVLEGGAREVRNAWRTAARLFEHGIPAPAPLAILLSPRARAVFAPAGAILSLSAIEGDARLRPRAAVSLGTLLGLLFDRALALSGPLAASIVFEARGDAFVAVGARIRSADALDPAVTLAMALDLLPRASRIERARFVIAFLRAQQLPARDLALLRARLRKGADRA